MLMLYRHRRIDLRCTCQSASIVDNTGAEGPDNVGMLAGMLWPTGSPHSPYCRAYPGANQCSILAALGKLDSEMTCIDDEEQIWQNLKHR